MATNVRNLAELGINLQKIVSRLMANDDLVNLLYYNDMEPLDKPHLTMEQKRNEVFNKLIKIIPRVGPKETANSLITIRVANGHTFGNNTEFMTLTISVEIFVPLTQWILKNENLRPFLIMSEIKKSLNGKEINGLGKIKGGDFDLNFLTEEISCYEQIFKIVQYD